MSLKSSEIGLFLLFHTGTKRKRRLERENINSSTLVLVSSVVSRLKARSARMFRNTKQVRGLFRQHVLKRTPAWMWHVPQLTSITLQVLWKFVICTVDLGPVYKSCQPVNVFSWSQLAESWRVKGCIALNLNEVNLSEGRKEGRINTLDADHLSLLTDAFL